LHDSNSKNAGEGRIGNVVKATTSGGGRGRLAGGGWQGPGPLQGNFSQPLPL